MAHQVSLSPDAVKDLESSFDHMLKRELNSPTGDLDIPARAIEAIERACQLLAHSPFSCRKVGDSAFVRDLIISFGGTRKWHCLTFAIPSRSSLVRSGISA